MDTREVPLHEPAISEREQNVVTDVVSSGELKGAGTYDKRFTKQIEEEFDADTVLVTPSCTHALEMTALLLELNESDEVILPSYTFPSTATAFYREGATLTFCDIDPETLNMDPDHLAELASDNTAAVVPVHYAGVACEMDRICAIADDYDAAVVEDAAQAVNATYDDEYLGTIGDFGCYSFHGTKSYVAGEGGALVISDETHVERAEIIRQKGTNYDQFRRGEVEKYEWVDTGSSYVLSELQTAIASVQLDRREEIRAQRAAVYDYYMDAFSELVTDGRLEVPTVPSDCQTNYHVFYIVADSESKRDELVAHLQNRGIGAAQHYEPLHTSPMGRELRDEPDALPITERMAARLLRLPVHPNVTVADRRHVVTAVKSFFE